MLWYKKRKYKVEGDDIEGAAPVVGRDLSAKRSRAKVIDLTDTEVEFKAPLRTLSTLRGKRVHTYIRRGFYEYVRD